MIVRFNDIRRGVSAIELENSINGVAHNNYATENTGGILVFKDPNLIDQSGNHQVISNVLDANNTDNFGTGFVSVVPRGTGALIVSNDDTVFQGNIIRNNDSFGIALLDQEAVNILAAPNPGPFPVPSADKDSFNNLIRRNVVTGNGTNHDEDRTPLGANLLLALGTDAGNQENCFQLNIVPAPTLIAPLGNVNDCD
jgi:hypothetical protein